MVDPILSQFVAAAITGLCAAPETSVRNPGSIAKKAVEVACAAYNILTDLTPVK